ncbi:avirulence D protein (AvrD) [Leucobacter luti]|uniref:Avirulence D protein (AvrD) n=2 Tax=Leucobacter luti TaxID=340320 RepID=A0A4R6S0D9_9MICO|nr:avirulence D protein (AvrD) [Leucobacter luti]
MDSFDTTQSSNALDFVSILGSPELRYFGGGFRRVNHQVEKAELTKEGELISIEGAGSALYPLDWSLDAAGDPRAVHLSTFDAISLAAAVVVRASGSSEDLQQVISGVVNKIRVKAPSVVKLDTRQVDITCDCVLSSESRRASVSAFVGGFTVYIEIGLGPKPMRSIDDQIRGFSSANSFAGGKAVIADPRTVDTTQELVVPSLPLTCIEEMAMFGQLCQLSVYLLKETSREGVPNLWLRNLVLTRSSQHPSRQISAKTVITRDRELRFGEQLIADVRISSHTNYGASVQASFGYHIEEAGRRFPAQF